MELCTAFQLLSSLKEVASFIALSAAWTNQVLFIHPHPCLLHPSWENRSLFPESDYILQTRPMKKQRYASNEQSRLQQIFPFPHITLTRPSPACPCRTSGSGCLPRTGRAPPRPAPAKSPRPGQPRLRLGHEPPHSHTPAGPSARGSRAHGSRPGAPRVPREAAGAGTRPCGLPPLPAGPARRARAAAPSRRSRGEQPGRAADSRPRRSPRAQRAAQRDRKSVV